MKPQAKRPELLATAVVQAIQSCQHNLKSGMDAKHAIELAGRASGELQKGLPLHPLFEAKLEELTVSFNTKHPDFRNQLTQWLTFLHGKVRRQAPEIPRPVSFALRNVMEALRTGKGIPSMVIAAAGQEMAGSLAPLPGEASRAIPGILALLRGQPDVAQEKIQTWLTGLYNPQAFHALQQSRQPAQAPRSHARPQKVVRKPVSRRPSEVAPTPQVTFKKPRSI